MVVGLTDADTSAGTVTVPQQTQASTTIRSADTTIVSVGDVTVREGGAATFTVTMSGGTHEDEFEVAYNGATTSAADDDFTGGLSGAVEITRARTARFTIQTWDDELAEDPETFGVTLTLRPPQGGFTNPVVLGRATATGTITDNDMLTATVEGPITVVEGQNANFTVSLSDATLPANSGVTVHYEVGGTAEAGEDYGDPEPDPLRITSGSTGTIMIATTADDLLEGFETLTVTLTEAGSGCRSR